MSNLQHPNTPLAAIYHRLVKITLVVFCFGILVQVVSYSNLYLSDKRTVLTQQTMQLASIVDNNFRIIDSYMGELAADILPYHLSSEEIINNKLTTFIDSAKDKVNDGLIEISSLKFHSKEHDITQYNMLPLKPKSDFFALTEGYILQNQANPYKLVILYKIYNLSGGVQGYISSVINPYKGFISLQDDMTISLVTDKNSVIHSIEPNRTLLKMEEKDNSLTMRYIPLSYAPNLILATESTIDWLHVLLGCAPASLLLIGAVLLLHYRLREALVEPIANIAAQIENKTDSLAQSSIICREIAIISDALQARIKLATEEEHVLLEDAVRKRTSMLEEELAARTTMLNNASHEIRTPLQGVLNLSYALKNEWDRFDEAKRREMIKILADSAKRLNNFVDSLLDLSKIDAGKMLFEYKLINVGEIIEEVIAEFVNAQIVGTDAVAIKYDKEKGPKFTILGDENKIRQLIRNLLSNAIKFTQKGEVRIKIQRLGKDELLVAVRDEGIGIPVQEIGKIFEPFVQSSFTKYNGMGTGLGLALCKEIVKGHHGSIWAENNEGPGATFKFIIPLASDNKNSARVGAVSHSRAISTPIEHRPITVLIIDDEEICHYSTKVILSMEPKITVLSSYSVEEGLEMLRNDNTIEIVLLDMMMPGVDGLEMLKILKNDPNMDHIRIIVQSGIANPQQMQQAIKMGADAFTTKPMSNKLIDQIYTLAEIR